MEHFVSFILLFLDIYSLDNLISAYFIRSRGMIVKLLSFASYSLFMIVLTTNYLPNLLSVKFCVIILVFTAIFHFLYRAKYLQLVVISLVWYAIYLASDVFGIACYLRILNVDYVQWQSSLHHFTICAVSTRIVLCCVTCFFKIWYQKRYKTEFVTPKEWLLIAIYPLVTFLVIFATVYPALISDKLTDSLLLANTALVLSNFILLCWVGIINNAHATAQELLLSKEKIRIEKEFHCYLDSSYAMQRSLTHDFKNNLLVIKTMVENGELGAVQNFVSELAQNSSLAPLVVRSNNTAVDAVLNQKHGEACSRGVGVEYNINDLSQLPIADLDLVTILANALDNSIAAAEQSEQKAIWVRFTCKNGETVLRISNSVAKKVAILNDEIVTTKQDKLAFGYGLKNIKSALSKYDSVFDIECDDEIFTLTVII